MSLVRVGFIAIPPGARPGFDHADVYQGGRRMCVAHTGAERLDVLDCERQTFLRSLPDVPGVAGVLVGETHDLLLTSDRAAARVSVFRCSTEELLGQAAVGPHQNGLAYDRSQRRLYAFNLGEPLGKNCTASIVDVDSMQPVAELPLPGRPRWALYEQDWESIYVNIRDPAQVVVIDQREERIERAFAVPSPGPHGLWLNRGRLFCATAGGALVVLDRDSGRVFGSLPLPGAPDVVLHDSDIARLYVAIGDPGIVCSFDTRADVELVETVETEVGAHTSGWDPDGRRLYVFFPASSGTAVYEERD